MRGAAPAAVQQMWDASAWGAAQVRASSSPAFLARADGVLILANAAAEGLIERGGLPPALRALVVDTRFKNAAQSQRVSLPVLGGVRSFDFAFLPLAEGAVLAVGRETTLESNLVAGLSASRDLFRDLALCFSDLAFETNADGRFTWVSPGGIAGFAAADMQGATAAEVFGAEASAFATRVRVDGQEMWVAAKSGADACLEVTAMPVVDGRGAWCGTRGVARDMTRQRLAERAAAQTKKREELIDAIVSAVRAQIEPRRMILAAADAFAGATDSDAVTIQAPGADETVGVGTACPGLAHVFEATTNYRGKPNGTLRLSRSAAKGPYGGGEQALVDAVAPHLGIALALAESLKAGAASRVDGPSGLLNRRTFMSEASKRLAAGARSGRELSLIVFDCDQGEEASDRSDEFLASIGRSLGRACSARELAGRLDEDSFAVVCDGWADPQSRAQELCGELTSVLRSFGVQDEAGVSGGCAVATPEGGETLEDLFGRAACALHEAKREGRNRVALARPSQEVRSCSSG
jgi:diguanylate cyclase (GGDEF)-like protein